MIASLQEVDAIVADEIDDPVLLREAAQPGSCQTTLQGLGLADARERIADGRFDLVKDPAALPLGFPLTQTLAGSRRIWSNRVVVAGSGAASNSARRICSQRR